jgi:hypothetical protein
MISLTKSGEALREKLLVDMDTYELPEFKRLSAGQKAQLLDILPILLQPPEK